MQGIGIAAGVLLPLPPGQAVGAVAGETTGGGTVHGSPPFFGVGSYIVAKPGRKVNGEWLAQGQFWVLYFLGKLV